MSTIIARASEDTHWYREDGAPQYTVVAKNGSDRPTTLRDARSMSLVPSVTTIIKVASAPGLEKWKLEQMLLAAMTLPKRPNELEKDYIARIVHDSKETGKQAAEAGTRIHESIQGHYEDAPTGRHQESVAACVAEITKHFGERIWISERSFASKMGFGGKCDLFCAGSLNVVIDIKTKEFGPDDKIDAYAEHGMQLAAYREGLEIPDARCANVFVSRSHPGVVKVVEWSAEDLDRYWQMFKCLLEFWKLKNKFGENNG